MARSNKTTTGKETKLMLMLDGIQQKVLDNVLNFRRTGVKKKREYEYMGEPGREIDVESNGHSGNFDINHTDGSIEDFIDAYNALKALGLPASIQIVDTQRYKNGTSRTHIYTDVQIESDETSKRRGEAISSSFGWDSGQERIRA